MLTFESNFESGNLDRVGIVSANEYNLFLNFDTNTKGYALWFYFAVSNTEEGRTVRFNILNCTKSAGGSKTCFEPFMLSQHDFETNGADWAAEGRDIVYARNGITRDNSGTVGDEGTFYTLGFSYTFRHAKDTVHFAYVRPYTVSMHRGVLREIGEEVKAQGRKVVVLEEEELCRRLRGVGGELAKKPQSKVDPVRNKEQKANTILTVEKNATLHEKSERRHKAKPSGEHSVWHSAEFQVETDSFTYRQETLCRVLSGLPVEAITVTAHK